MYRDQRGPRPLFVGVHPDYQRRPDVEIQTRLVRPDLEVVYGLPELTECIRQWVRSFKSLSPLGGVTALRN
jgi:hypothetical protein